MDLYGLGMMRDFEAYRKPLYWMRFAKCNYLCNRRADARLSMNEARVKSTYNPHLNRVDRHMNNDGEFYYSDIQKFIKGEWQKDDDLWDYFEELSFYDYDFSHYKQKEKERIEKEKQEEESGKLHDDVFAQKNMKKAKENLELKKINDNSNSKGASLSFQALTSAPFLDILKLCPPYMHVPTLLLERLQG